MNKQTCLIAIFLLVHLPCLSTGTTIEGKAILDIQDSSINIYGDLAKKLFESSKKSIIQGPHPSIEEKHHVFNSNISCGHRESFYSCYWKVKLSNKVQWRDYLRRQEKHYDDSPSSLFTLDSQGITFGSLISDALWCLSNSPEITSNNSHYVTKYNISERSDLRCYGRRDYLKFECWFSLNWNDENNEDSIPSNPS